MWTPATALLWECWRLSRRTLAILIFVPTLLTATLLFARLVVPAAEWPPDLQRSPTYAFHLAVLAGILGWIWTVNVDRRRGFALSLGFARPIRTWVLVGVPMAYIGVSCAVTYLVPMLTLRATFDIPFPLFPIAALVSTLGLVFVAVAWWTGDPTRRRVAWAWAGLWLVGCLWYLKQLPPGGYALDRWPETFSFSVTAYVGMALVSVAAVGLAIVGVARQRRGDDRMALAQPASKPADTRARPSLAGWLAERLGVRCPISSPTRAQLWFETATVGGTVLKYGALIALVAPAVLTVAVPPGDLYLIGALMFPVPVVVGLLSILGIRRQQGISYLGAFAATRAMGTARLVALKVLVASMSVLAAWAAIGTSLWIFAVRLAVWGPGPSADLADFVRSLPSNAWIGVVVAVVVAVVTTMAGGLTLHALLVLNARRVILSAVGLGVYIALSVSAAAVGWVAPDTILMAHVWIVAGAAVVGTAFLLRRLAAERIFTSRGLMVVLGIWVGITLMMPDQEAWFLMSCLPLTVAALAPWAFSRVRHR